jgi:pyruvate dehydrogenase E2 component (dihydrolipoamide acetyltransferase)
LPHASPSVRKFARELGVPLEEVKGSGAKGRITAEDVQSFTRAVMSGCEQTKSSAARSGQSAGAAAGDGAGLGLIPWPKVDFAKFGPIERKDAVAHQEDQRRQPAPQLGHDPARHQPRRCRHHRPGGLPGARLNKENEKSGVKVTMLAFLIKACVAALRKFPEFNASIDGEQLVLQAVLPHRFCRRHTQWADGAGDQGCRQEGRHADLAGDGRAGQEGARRQARPGRDVRRELHDLVLGGIGGRYFTPIINAPEVAILGVCRSTMEPVWDGKAFVPRLMLPLSLSWDHRVIDGAAAARFNVYLGQILGDFRRVLL